MRLYKYQAIMEKQGQRIVWDGSAISKTAFCNSDMIQRLIKEGWTIAKAYRRAPERRRIKPYISFAFVDMGQAAR